MGKIRAAHAGPLMPTSTPLLDRTELNSVCGAFRPVGPLWFVEGEETMPQQRGRWWMLVGLSMLVTLSLTGCVERRYTVRTEPPGALVIANGEPIGITPVSKSFVFYGDRSIRIIKEGYETKDIVQPIKAPWFDNLLTEFFTENLIPYTFRDDVEFNYKLEPQQIVDPNELQARAEATRAEGQMQPKPRRTGVLGFFGF